MKFHHNPYNKNLNTLLQKLLFKQKFELTTSWFLVWLFLQYDQTIFAKSSDVHESINTLLI